MTKLSSEYPKCRYCGRPLRTEASILRGYGPECSKKHQKYKMVDLLKTETQHDSKKTSRR